MDVVEKDLGDALFGEEDATLFVGKFNGLSDDERGKVVDAMAEKGMVILEE